MIVFTGAPVCVIIEITSIFF